MARLSVSRARHLESHQKLWILLHIRQVLVRKRRLRSIMDFLYSPYEIPVQFLELFPHLKRKFHRIAVIFVQHCFSVRISQLVFAVLCVLNHRNMLMVAYAEPFSVDLFFMPFEIVFHFFSPHIKKGEVSPSLQPLCVFRYPFCGLKRRPQRPLKAHDFINRHAKKI